MSDCDGVNHGDMPPGRGNTPFKEYLAAIRDTGFVGHSHQIGQAHSLHLAKDLTAMDLSGHLADCEFGSDLLI